jgi:hypothetical protein
VAFLVQDEKQKDERKIINAAQLFPGIDQKPTDGSNRSQSATADSRAFNQ